MKKIIVIFVVVFSANAFAADNMPTYAPAPEPYHHHYMRYPHYIQPYPQPAYIENGIPVYVSPGNGKRPCTDYERVEKPRRADCDYDVYSAGGMTN